MPIVDKIRSLVDRIFGESEAAAEEKAPTVVDTIEPLAPGQVQVWKRRLEKSKAMLEPYWELADELKAEYLGRMDPRFELLLPAVASQAGKPINFVSSFINTTLPQVMPANPWPIVNAERPGDEFKEGAKRLEAR